MLDKTHGIVLRSFKYSETSLISKIFTEKHGVLSFLVPGIRSSKNKKGNVLQPGQLLEIDLYFRKNKNFQRFKEFKVAYIPIQILTDVRRFSVLTFLVELSIQLVNEQEENTELFHYLHQAIIDIDQKAIHGLTPIEHLLGISKIMGFYPSNNYDVDRPYFNLQDGAFQEGFRKSKEILDFETSLSFSSLLDGSRNFSQSKRQVFLQSLLIYYQLHIPSFKPLTSHEILHEVLAS